MNKMNKMNGNVIQQKNSGRVKIMFCPIIKTECRTDCAWFREGRRKYQDRVEGVCSLNVSKDLKQIKESIDKLNATLFNKEF